MPDWSSLIKDFGWPGAILVGLAVIVWVKVMPIAERMSEAWVSRQKEMIEHSKELTAKTIEIQVAIQKSVESAQRSINDLPRVLVEAIERIFPSRPNGDGQ